MLLHVGRLSACTDALDRNVPTMPLIPHLLQPSAAAVGERALQLAVPVTQWPQLDEADMLALAIAVCDECNLNADQASYVTGAKGAPNIVCPCAFDAIPACQLLLSASRSPEC